MSTSILNIGEVLTGYSLSSTAASKATLTDAVNFTAVPADGDSLVVTFAGNSLTIKFLGTLSGAADDNSAEILTTSITTGQQARNAVRNAINGDATAVGNNNLAYGTSTYVNEAQGLIGLNAQVGTNNSAGNADLTLEAGETGPNVLSVAAGTNLSNATLSLTTTDTGSDASGTLNIPLSSLGFSENDFTSGEAATSGGDYRKFLYHVIEKFYIYLQAYEKIDQVTIDAPGQSFAVGDELDFTGGSPEVSAVATVSQVDANGGIVAVSVTNQGRGYESVPTVTVDSTNGINASLTATITDRIPTNLAIARGSLTEDIDTETLNRLYQVTFGFEATALEIKPEA